MARPKVYTDAERARFLRSAAQAIAERGVDALSLRAVAAGAEGSTSGIYALFGSRDALVAAVVAEAGGSFAQAQSDAVEGVDAVADLRALGLAYRTWAVEHPSLYEVMFAGRVPPSLLGDTERSMDPLWSVLGRLCDEGRLVGDDVPATALAVWGAVHGAVSLELALWPHQAAPDSQAQYEAVLDAVQRAWVRPAPGATAPNATVRDATVAR